MNENDGIICHFEHYRVYDCTQDGPIPYGPSCAIFDTRAGGHLYRYMRGVTKWKPAEKGGLTICSLFTAEGVRLANAWATCSKLDSFSYKIGRAIAEGRARKILTMRGE